MRIAVCSDIHANLPALAACLGDAHVAGVDEVWCLGDILGRGPHPDAVAKVVLAECQLILTGNHDRVALGLDPLEWLGPDAAGARLARAELDPLRARQLSDRPPAATRHGLLCIHGGHEDPNWQFISTAADARGMFDALGAETILVGHTHQPLVMREKGAQVAITRRPHRVNLGGVRQILNPGAVGIPQKSDPRASWMLIDLFEGTCTWQRSAYELQRVHDDMIRAGLPERAARPFLAG